MMSSAPNTCSPGSVVCDVARPRDVSAMVAAVRDDILVIDGGMVDVPGPVISILILVFRRARRMPAWPRRLP
jgi:predicted amino acid dehydrogenase